MDRNGFIIINNLLSPAEILKLRNAIEPHLNQSGRNNFEGTKTQRVYALFSKDRMIGDRSQAFDDIAMHPRITAILDRLLLPNYLITAYQAIKIHPGETRQPFHHDDQFMNIPRPHKAFSIATIWAIDDFTVDNGATLVFPGSHKWGQALPPIDLEPVPCVMPAGSVVVFLSTLWHGGGANISSGPRLALTAQYCEPWLRPQENQMLSVPFEVVESLHPRIQSMIGYSIHPPFIGHVDGRHPLNHLPRLISASKKCGKCKCSQSEATRSTCGQHRAKLQSKL